MISIDLPPLLENQLKTFATQHGMDEATAIREAIQLYLSQQQTLSQLKAAIQKGLDDLDNGRFSAFDSPDALRKHLDTL